MIRIQFFFLSNSRKPTEDLTNLISVLQNEGVYRPYSLYGEGKKALEQNDEKSDDDDDDDEEMPELATDSDDNDNAENEAKLESEQFHGKNE